jgi:hypothetical protein
MVVGWQNRGRRTRGLELEVAGDGGIGKAIEFEELS